MTTPPNMHSQIEGLATLLVLDDEIRKLATLREFGFFTTNETHRLMPYHSAFLWQKRDITGAVLLAQSGTAEIDRHAPVNQWLKQLIDTMANAPNPRDIQVFNLIELDPPGEGDHPWVDHLPAHVLWCPLLNKTNDISGGLLYFREEPFTEAEIKMLRWLIASFQYTWVILTKPKIIPSWKKIREKRNIIIASVLTVAFMLFPIRLSVLGTATVVPKDPVLINAPMQGVIKSFAVSPGQVVKPGQLLLTLDKTDLIADAEINSKEYSLTAAKLRTAINQGFGNNKESRAEAPILQAQLAIDKAKADYTNTLLKRADVMSPTNGIVVFDSKEDWIGQPVHTGQRILMVANPQHVQLKILVPTASIIRLEIGSDGDFFVYGQLSPLEVKVKSLGYNAKLLPSRILAYQLSADFVDPGNLPQLGAEGSIRLYGNRVPLIYYILHRPLQAVRQTLGI